MLCQTMEYSAFGDGMVYPTPCKLEMVPAIDDPNAPLAPDICLQHDQQLC